MVINDNEYGRFEVDQDDDGTLDTVILVFPLDITGEEHEFRFSIEYASDFRNEYGVMTDDGFTELAKESIDAYIEQYLIP